jgi:molybdenum cofactor guanylyltransferase
MKFLAAIQAGGRSARMGVDKAWVTLAERPLIEYVLKAAQPFAQRLVVVISHEMPQQVLYEQLAAKWHAQLLFDPHDHCGPLGGIHTALSSCAADEIALILACDLPFITSEFLLLLALAHSTTTTPAITIPLDQTGRRQMLAGFYDQGCLPAVEQLLAGRKLRVDGLCGHVKVQEIDFSAYAHLSNAANLLNNLNTQEELRTAAFVKDNRG